jgi:hypothetical protein
MFKQLATLVSGLMGRLFTAPSLSQVEQPSPSAKPLPAKSIRGSRPAVRKPASQKPKSKASAAPQTKAAVSRKPKPKPVRQTSGETGLQVVTPASQTRQHVRSAAKAKPARVPSIKAALLSQQEQAPALTPTAVQSGVLGQVKVTVHKTRQPAKPALTKKRKAAVLTSQVKKPTPNKTAARTRTARPSKASGS